MNTRITSVDIRSNPAGFGCTITVKLSAELGGDNRNPVTISLNYEGACDEAGASPIFNERKTLMGVNLRPAVDTDYPYVISCETGSIVVLGDINPTIVDQARKHGINGDFDRISLLKIRGNRLYLTIGTPDGSGTAFIPIIARVTGTSVQVIQIGSH